jgi:hypothetical protein
MLPKPAEFAAAMRRFGISDDSKIVTYSTANPQWATRVWWVLRVYGFDNAAVLNGGFPKWAKEGRAVEAGRRRPRIAGNFTERPAKPLMADKNDVLAAIGDGAVCTINALQAPQHAGMPAATPMAGPGRIAGSVNVPTAGSSTRRPTPSCRPPSCARNSMRCMRSTKNHHLLRRRHRGERDRACPGHARPPRCAALRRLDVGMGDRRGLADGGGLTIETPETFACRGPRPHALMSVATASSSPIASSSTPPSARLRTQPRIPSADAVRSAQMR